MHQPLHCADNQDRGGNSVRVVLGGRRTNLHAVWDAAVVEAFGGSEGELAGVLEEGNTPAGRSAWPRGSIVDWANETFGVAKTSVYRGIQGSGGNYAPVILPADYAQSNWPVAAVQLERAGVRLAALLNRRLG